MPRLISHHTPHRQSRRPRRGLNRPACARPVAGAAALYCAQQGSLVSRLVTTGWAVLASSQPRDFARDDARLFRDAKYGLAPVWRARQCERRQMACCSRACPYCRSPLPLGPTFAFPIGLGLQVANRRRWEGHWQRTSVTALGGISVGDGRGRRVRVRAGHGRRRVRFPDEL